MVRAVSRGSTGPVLDTTRDAGNSRPGRAKGLDRSSHLHYGSNSYYCASITP
nr:MAG TPA: hypothetical protein [Caudoviricetes sp.]